MKRSFQVATAFTGAVACATALAPMADAATARVTPDTTAGNCAANSGPALHVYYSKKEKHSLAACVKGDGFFAFGAGRKWAGICGGAYSGSFFYHVPGTDISGISNFSRGYLEETFRQPDSIYWVSLHTYHYIQTFTSCANHG